jgi:hypothetical protein
MNWAIAPRKKLIPVTSHLTAFLRMQQKFWPYAINEACPESKDTKVLNTNNIFNLQKRHCEWIACT